MSHRYARTIAAFVIVVLLASPAAFAARRDGGFDPSFGSQIVKILKQFAHKLGITTHDDIVITPCCYHP